MGQSISSIEASPQERFYGVKPSFCILCGGYINHLLLVTEKSHHFEAILKVMQAGQNDKEVML